MLNATLLQLCHRIIYFIRKIGVKKMAYIIFTYG
jgi:hypothetical protein